MWSPATGQCILGFTCTSLPPALRGSSSSSCGSGKIEGDVIARGVFTSVCDIRHYNKSSRSVKRKYADPLRHIGTQPDTSASDGAAQHAISGKFKSMMLTDGGRARERTGLVIRTAAAYAHGRRWRVRGQRIRLAGP
jgi:hypothetical protein